MHAYQKEYQVFQVCSIGQNTAGIYNDPSQTKTPLYINATCAIDSIEVPPGCPSQGQEPRFPKQRRQPNHRGFAARMCKILYMSIPIFSIAVVARLHPSDPLSVMRCSLRCADLIALEPRHKLLCLHFSFKCSFFMCAGAFLLGLFEHAACKIHTYYDLQP